MSNKIVKNIIKSTAFILAVIMLGGILTPTIVFASAPNLVNLEDDLMYEFVNEFSDEYFEIENVDVYLNEITIEVSAEDPFGVPISAEIEITLGGEYIAVTTLEFNEAGFLEENVYYIDFSQLENFAGADGNHVEFAIHEQMGDEIQMTPFNNQFDVTNVVNVTNNALGLAFDALNTLLRAGEVVALGGAAMVGLTADTLIDNVPIVGPLARLVLNTEQALKGFDPSGGLLGHQRFFGNLRNGQAVGGVGGATPRGAPQQGQQGLQTMNQSHSHFTVAIVNGEIFIGEGMDLQEAANRLRNGENVWSATAAEAREVARLAGNNLPSLIQNDAPNGFSTELYLDHILPSPRTGGRSYFGTNLRRGWW